eukprot:54924-Chlamydomonas_euryale.AAC.1
MCVISEGPRGCRIADASGGAARAPADDVKVVDTIGAGDAFSSGVLAAMLRGAPLAACARLGCDVGAAVVTVAGAQVRLWCGRTLAHISLLCGRVRACVAVVGTHALVSFAAMGMHACTRFAVVESDVCICFAVVKMHVRSAWQCERCLPLRRLHHPAGPARPCGSSHT